MTGNYTGDPFVLAFTGGNDQFFLLRFMDDAGEDLAHIELTKSGDTYTMNSTVLVRGFLNPIDSEIIGNKIYVLEFKNSWLNSWNTTRIWEVTFPGTDTSIEDPEGELAKSFSLHQNYPNPFNPSTTISFELNKPGQVELSVFDALGRKVNTLVNSQMNATNHSVNFDASALSSGVYFYTLKVDGITVQTRKMLLMK